MIFVTGLCELAGSIALVTKPLRWWAGIGFAAYAICVWPANFKHALDGIDLPYIANSWLYHGPRLALSRAPAGLPAGWSTGRGADGGGLAFYEKADDRFLSGLRLRYGRGNERDRGKTLSLWKRSAGRVPSKPNKADRPT